jgi:hypothetical protein
VEGPKEDRAIDVSELHPYLSNVFVGVKQFQILHCAGQTETVSPSTASGCGVKK